MFYLFLGFIVYMYIVLSREGVSINTLSEMCGNHIYK